MPSTSIPSELLDAVFAEPESDAPRGVVADWLLARKDPLGELIQLQLARAAGKKGTLAKEKRLHNPLAFPFHPVQAIVGAVAFECLERGFPAVLRPPLPVDDGELKKELARWRPHFDAPGWTTVRRLSLGATDSPIIAELLSAARMPLLEALEGVGPRVLTALGDAERPLRELVVYGAVPEDLPRLRCPNLSSLTWFADRRAARRMRLETVGASLPTRLGVAESLRSLILGGFSYEGHAAASLRLFEVLSQSLERLEVLGDDVTRVIVERPRRLTWVLNAWSIDAAETELATLPTNLELSIEFHPRGYFTKRTRPLFAERIRRAAQRFEKVAFAVD
ncbi:MAG: hypothetical protein U0271_06180 [Polyangiaceae bacterium]